MAIYSLNLGFISRSEGRSSVGFSAYISASQHQDVRTGDVYNYASKEDVVASRVLAPEGAPEWVLNPTTLWNHVEQFEDDIISPRFRESPDDPEKTRRSFAYRDKLLGSAVTAQTVMGALPIELNHEQAEACVEEFLKSRFVSRNLVVHYAIHWDSGNPHFHGLITRRPFVDGEFFKKKDREIVSRAEHKITRKHWEVVANKHLALAGCDVRIDCRSHKDRGSIFEVGVHEGFWAQKLAERGEYSRLVEHNETVRQRNIEILCDRPEALIHEVSQKRTIFTRQHLEDEIIRRVGGDETLFAILKTRVESIENFADLAPSENFASDLKALAAKLTDRLLSNPDSTHSVGENINRDAVFTSTAYQQQEDKIVTLADTLHARTSKSLDFRKIQEALQENEKSSGFELSEEQQNAILHLCTGPDIRVLNGRAGTGKTTLLKVVAGAYQNAGYNVFGTSFQGKAVEIMEREIGIECKTLDSLLFTWERHARQKALVESGCLWGKPYLYAFQKMKELEKQRFMDKDVILVDEANMISGSLWEPFLKEATSKGVKVLIIQDTAQIKSREPGDYGRLFAERFGSAETREVMRQKVNWQKECSALLNDGRILDGLRPYQDKGHIQWQENKYNTQEVLIQSYLRDLRENPGQTRIALAYRNKDVDALNQLIRQNLKTQGLLSDSFSVMEQEFSMGDRVRFTQNDHHGRYVTNTHASFFQAIKERFNPTLPQGVKNGTFGTILEGSSRNVKVRLDDGRCVKFDPREYGHLTHGYALGIHKSEGSTFDRNFVALDPLLDSSTLLVAMTRHRHNVQAFVSREEIVDFKELVDKIGRGSSREILQDYQVPEAQKPYLERVQQYRDLMSESINLREEMEGSCTPMQPLHKHHSYGAYLVYLEQKKKAAKDILAEWDAHKPYVRLAGMRRDVLEIESGLRQRTLSDLEHRASIQVQGYMDLVRETRQLWKIISATHPPAFAKNHSRYEEYQQLKIERDSVAAVFYENPKLYQPFLRIIKDESGLLKDYWGNPADNKDRFITLSIKQHAAAHLQSQQKKDFEERLSLDDREFYGTVKSYKEATVEAAALYHISKQPQKEFFMPSEMLEHQFHKACTIRDALALEITAFFEGHQRFLDLFKIQEEKLLPHATSGEIREKINAYQSEKDVTIRASKARDLQELIHSPTKDRSRVNHLVNHLLKQEKLDFQRVRFDILYAEKLKTGEIPRDGSPEYIFNHLTDYRNASQDVGRAWMSDVRAQNPHIWEEAITNRRVVAQRLINFEPALTLFKAMNPEGIEKLNIHARQTHLNPEHSSDQKSFIKADSVLEATRGRTREIAENLLGAHNYHLSQKFTLRFGAKGKIAVHIAGDKEGLWHDFSTGEGGDIFKLVQREKGLSFKESVEYCRWFLGVEEPSLRAPKERGNPKKLNLDRFANKARDDDTTARLNAVTDLHEKSQAIVGTVAETYLRVVRGIQGALGDDLRFLSKGTSFTYNDEKKVLTHDAFAAFGRNAREVLSVVQITKLHKDGTRAYGKDDEKLTKIQYGLSKGAFVTLQKSAYSDLVFITEGLETGLSIKEAGVEGRIVASLGIQNIKNYEGPEKKIILCADSDGPHARTNAVIQHAQEYLQTCDRSVIVVRPSTEGQDFNDVLKAKGAAAVREHLTPPALRMAEFLQDPQFANRDISEKIPKLSVELQEKLEAFKQDPYDRSLKSDLLSHAKIIRHNPDLRDSLRILNPEVSRQMEALIKEQQRYRGMER